MLDTNVSHGGTQRDWLEAQLVYWRPRSRWLLANYHRPAFPAVKSPGDARLHWVPLFERHDLDLALESDGHVLKRTVPIRNGRPSADGVVYLGEGGLGVRQRTPRERWYLESPGFATSAHHVQVLLFGTDALRYEAVGLDGQLLDHATFRPRPGLLHHPDTAAPASGPAPPQARALERPPSTRAQPGWGCLAAPLPTRHAPPPGWLVLMLALFGVAARRRSA